MIAQTLADAYFSARATLYTAETGTDLAYAQMQSIFSQAESLGIVADLVAALN